MADPVSISAVSAAASTATATGTTAGAMSAGAAAASTATAAAAGGAAATAPAGAPSIGAAASSAAAPLQVIVMPPAHIVATPQSTIVMPPAHIVASPTALAPSAPARAMTLGPATGPTGPGPAPPSPPLPPAASTETVRATALSPQTKPAPPRTDLSPPRIDPLPDPLASQLSRGCGEHDALKPSPHRPKDDPVGPQDPHERERSSLSKKLDRFPDLSEREQQRVLDDVWRWQEEERRRYPDRTPVIGPHGHLPRDEYDKAKKKAEARREAQNQLRIGASIAANPLAGATALEVYGRTGDSEKAAAAGELVQTLTDVVGGGKSGARKPLAMRGSSRAPAPRRDRDRKGKGSAVRKAPAGKPAPTPPKLTPRQERLQAMVQKLRTAMDRIKDSKVTISIVVVEKNGVQEVWLSSSEPKVPAVVEKAAAGFDKWVRGSGNSPDNRNRSPEERSTYHHAEQDAVSFAWSNGYKVVELYPSRAACPDCSKLRGMGITVIDPP